MSNEMNDTSAQNQSLLMTAENPDGWKLEELLNQAISELHLKTEKLDSFGSHPTAIRYRQNNKDIIKLLEVARDMQTTALAFAAENPLTK